MFDRCLRRTRSALAFLAFALTLVGSPLQAQAPIDGAASARIGGLWFEGGRAGEGFYFEPLPDGRMLLTWYTFPVAGDAGEQFWLFGEGRITGDRFSSDLLISVSGGRFGEPFDPATLRLTPWGRIEIVFESGTRARLSYVGPPGYGIGLRTLTRLSGQALGGDLVAPFSTSLVAAGAYFTPERSGEGLFLHQPTALDGSAPGRQIALWYTHDEAGRPMWLYAHEISNEVSPPPPPGTFLFDVLRPVGTRFGSGFDSAAVRLEYYGGLSLQVVNCRTLALRFSRSGGGLTFTQTLTRLTSPLGLHCP